MPAYNFQSRFADQVRCSLKNSTIRAHRKDGRRPKPGQTLYLYTGMRTKKCHLLRKPICRRVSAVRITRRGRIAVRGHWLRPAERMNLAAKDGFACSYDLVTWFKRNHSLPFSGLLIEW